MGNLTIGLKKFLQNKNTVTVVGVILAIFVLYIAYTMRVKSSINPVSVPYAADQIPAGTQITEGMISTRQVPPSMLEGDVITSQSSVIDKYASADTVIPAGRLTSSKQLLELKQYSPMEVMLSGRSMDLNLP